MPAYENKVSTSEVLFKKVFREVYTHICVLPSVYGFANKHLNIFEIWINNNELALLKYKRVMTD